MVFLSAGFVSFVMSATNRPFYLTYKNSFFFFSILPSLYVAFFRIPQALFLVLHSGSTALALDGATI